MMVASATAQTGASGQRLTVYTSRHAHSSIEKGVKIAGLGRDNLRLVDADERYAMRVDALEAAIAADRAAGAVPAMVCATVGTTSSCARGSPARHRRALPPRERLAPRRCRARGQRHRLPRAPGPHRRVGAGGQLHLQPAPVAAHQLRLQLLLGCRSRRADRGAERPARVSAQQVDGNRHGHRLPRLAGAARPPLPRAQALVRHPSLRCRGLARSRPALHRARRMVCGTGGGERGVRACCAGFGRPRVLPPQARAMRSPKP